MPIVGPKEAAAPITAALAVALAGSVGGCAGPQSAGDPYSTDAALIANLWWGMLIAATVVLVVVLVLLFLGLRGPERRPSRRFAWTLVVTGGLAAPLIAAVALTVFSVQIGQSVVARPADAYVTVDVTGRQWWWEVRYLDDRGNPLATTANEIHLPVGKPVRFLLRSDNVIHSFWVPNLQGKTDMIPGQVNESWIEPEETGVFRGQCAEFCGEQHALMAFLVVVETEAEFQDWLRREASPAVEPQDPVLARGRDAFMASACKVCHAIRGTPADGTMGPDLTHVASRRSLAAATVPNTRGHMGGWVADPQSIKPGALMPPTPLEPEDLRAMLAYLESLR